MRRFWSFSCLNGLKLMVRLLLKNFFKITWNSYMPRQFSFWILSYLSLTLRDPDLAEQFRIWSGSVCTAKREWVYELGPGGVPGVGDDVPLLLTQCRAGHQAGGGGASLQLWLHASNTLSGSGSRLWFLISKNRKNFQKIYLFSFNIYFYFFVALVKEIHSSRKPSPTKHEKNFKYLFLEVHFRLPGLKYGSGSISS